MFRLCEIGADRDRATAGGFDRRDGVVDGARKAFVPHLLGASRYRHGRTFVRARDRDRLADAATRPGDDDHAVREPSAAIVGHRHARGSPGMAASVKA